MKPQLSEPVAEVVSFQLYRCIKTVELQSLADYFDNWRVERLETTPALETEIEIIYTGIMHVILNDDDDRVKLTKAVQRSLDFDMQHNREFEND